MSGIKDMLFGSKAQKSKVVDTTPDAYKALRAPVAGGISDLIGQGGGTYDGPLVAGLSDDERSILDTIFKSFGGATTAGTDAARGTLMDTAGGKYLAPESNPYLAATIEAAQRSTRDAFKNDILPSLKERFTMAGHTIAPSGSSPFEEAFAKTSGNYLNTLADIATSISGQNYDAERTRQVAAASALPEIDAADLSRVTTALQQIALPRLVEQYGIEQGQKLFTERMNRLLELLSIGAQASSGAQAKLEGAPRSPGLIEQVLGKVAGAGLGKII
jgi:hypothetical protein